MSSQQQATSALSSPSSSQLLASTLSSSSDADYEHLALDGLSPPTSSHLPAPSLAPDSPLTSSRLPDYSHTWQRLPSMARSSDSESTSNAAASTTESSTLPPGNVSSSSIVSPQVRTSDSAESSQPSGVFRQSSSNDSLLQPSTQSFRDTSVLSQRPVTVTRLSGPTKVALGAADDAIIRLRDLVHRSGVADHKNISNKEQNPEFLVDENRRKPPDGHLTIMIVGESGLGKSTLIETLFSLGSPLAETPKSQIMDQTKAICEHQALIETEHQGEKRVLHLTVVDTPGFGDELECGTRMRKIVEYVEEQFERTNKVFREEWGGGSKMVKFLDRGNGVHSHVDACLFFIAAHRLKNIDLEFMELLQDKVNIIPVIAKADTMTKVEMAEFRTIILSQLMERKIRIFPFDDTPLSLLKNKADDSETGYDSGDDSRKKVTRLLEECKSGNTPSQAYPPFAVIGSRIRLKNGEYGREYPWGSCEVENPKHCDFLALRERLLYDPWLSSLRTSTARKFVRWRKSKMQSNSVPAKSRFWNRLLWALFLMCLIMPVVYMQSPIEAEADPQSTFIHSSGIHPCCADDDWGNRTVIVFPRARQVPFLPSRPALSQGWTIAAATRSEAGWQAAAVEKLPAGSGWSIKFIPPKPTPSKVKGGVAETTKGPSGYPKFKEEMFDDGTAFYLAIWVVNSSGAKEHIAGSPFRVPKYVKDRQHDLYWTLDWSWIWASKVEELLAQIRSA